MWKFRTSNRTCSLALVNLLPDFLPLLPFFSFFAAPPPRSRASARMGKTEEGNFRTFGIYVVAGASCSRRGGVMLLVAVLTSRVLFPRPPSSSSSSVFPSRWSCLFSFTPLFESPLLCPCFSSSVSLRGDLLPGQVGAEEEEGSRRQELMRCRVFGSPEKNLLDCFPLFLCCRPLR